MKKILLLSSVKTLLFTITVTLWSVTAIAERKDPLQPYKRLPTISPFEKYCVSSSQPGSELKQCLNSQPKTKMYKKERNRSRVRIEKLNQIAYEVNIEGDEDPWVRFCLNQADWWCLFDCLEGVPCPH